MNMDDFNDDYQFDKRKILFVHYGDNWLRGSEIVLLDLLKSTQQNHLPPLLWCNSEMLAKKAQALGIEVITDNFVCLGYWTKPHWSFKQFFKILIKAIKIIRTYDIDLVHCNNGAPCQWMVPACKVTHQPLLLHLHARYMYRDRLTLFFHGADTIIGVSKTVINLFNKNEFSKQQVDVIYNGIDPNRVISSTPRNIRAELSAQNGDFVMLFMGSLISRKLVHNLLLAVKELATRYNVKLAIIGSGSEQATLTTLTNQLKLNKYIKFFPQTDKVADIYSSNIDCFISVPEEEVFGLTLAEASLAKLPIISSDIPGINEIYTHQHNALLVSPNNIDELVIAIRSLILSPKNRHKMAEIAHQHIRIKYSLKQQSVAFNRTYERLVTHNTSNSLTYIIATQISRLLKAFSGKFYNYIILRFSWRNSHD
jgi:hypothetical protein